MEFESLPAVKIAAMIRKKECSAAEVAAYFFARIAAMEPEIGAFLHLDESAALAEARWVDEAIAAGRPVGALAGVPVGLKDNICTATMPTTCASRMLGGFVPPYDATVVGRLRAAGAVLPGKLNMDEFAMGSTGENSYYRPAKNPVDATRVPGGSSSGPAAAVAAGMLPLALGSDTGGSLRQPAAFCGVVGLRPTYGAVPRQGLVAFASSLDQIGPVGRTAQDVSLLFSVLCGAADAQDATSQSYEYTPELDAEAVQDLKIGLPREYFGPEVSAGVRHGVERAVEKLEEAGARVVEVSLPSTRYALAAYCVLSSAEAASNLARYDGVRYGYSAGQGGTVEDMMRASRGEGFGREVRRRILLGTHVLGAGQRQVLYQRANAMRQQVAREFEAVFTTCDVLATPTTPTTAFKLGEKLGDPTGMYACDALTTPAALAGLPAVSVPCGADDDGLPVGLQLIGPRWSENRILSAAAACEAVTGGFAPKGGAAGE